MHTFSDLPLHPNADTALGEIHWFINQKASANEPMTAEEVQDLAQALNQRCIDVHGRTLEESIRSALGGVNDE